LLALLPLRVLRMPRTLHLVVLLLSILLYYLLLFRTYYLLVCPSAYDPRRPPRPPRLLLPRPPRLLLPRPKLQRVSSRCAPRLTLRVQQVANNALPRI